MKRFVTVLLILGQTIPPTFFGLHYKSANPYPIVNFGTLRLWDSGTRWAILNPSLGTYVFTNLDTYLSQASTHGLHDVLLTLSATPSWASSDPTNPACQYNASTGNGNTNGSCGVPVDIAINCTNTNGLNNCDGKTDGKNQNWRNFIYATVSHITSLPSSSYSTVNMFEIWNEFTDSKGSIFTAWEGTTTQLVRMAADASCIITGTGSNCTAVSMGVKAVGLLPNALITTPDAVMTAPDSTMWGNYISTPGALNAANLAAVHAYTQGGGTNAVPENIQTRYNTASTKLSAVAVVGFLVLSSEGGYGQTTNEPDPDLQAAFVSRYYLVGWTAGFQRLYWYAYDNPTWGTLWTTAGLTKAGVAYNTTYNWMVGQVMTTPCSAVGTVWTCGLGQNLVVWDTSQSCSNGACSTSNYTFPIGYSQYVSLDGTLITITGQTVPIGAKPIMLSGKNQPPAPVTNLKEVTQ